MALPIKTGFPDAITIGSDYIVRFRATDPTTGANVAGVKVSVASIFSDVGDTMLLVPLDVPTVLLVPEQPELSGTQVPHQ